MARTLKYKTPEAMQAVIDDYFDNHAFMDVVGVRVYAPTFSGLAYHLGISTQALRDYQDRDEYHETVRRAKQRIEISLEQRLFGNNVTGSIFNLKNNFGWKDKSESEITGKDGGPIEYKKIEALSDEELAAIASGSR